MIVFIQQQRTEKEGEGEDNLVSHNNGGCCIILSCMHIINQIRVFNSNETAPVMFEYAETFSINVFSNFFVADFRDRIIKVSLGHGHLVVTTSSQCYIYRYFYK